MGKIEISITFKTTIPRGMVNTEAEKCRDHYYLEQMSLSGGTVLEKTYYRLLRQRFPDWG